MFVANFVHARWIASLVRLMARAHGFLHEQSTGSPSSSHLTTHVAVALFGHIRFIYLEKLQSTKALLGKEDRQSVTCFTRSNQSWPSTVCMQGMGGGGRGTCGLLNKESSGLCVTELRCPDPIHYTLVVGTARCDVRPIVMPQETQGG